MQGAADWTILPVITEAVSRKGKNPMYDENVCGKREHGCGGGGKETVAVFEEGWKAADF